MFLTSMNWAYIASANGKVGLPPLDLSGKIVWVVPSKEQVNE